jgi:hypothetical protein
VDQDGWCGALVHHGPGGGTTHQRSTRGWLWARLLTMRAPRGRGSRGEPHHGRRWAAREWSEAGDELQRQWLELSGGGMLERPREGEEEWERGGMVRGSSCCFYRGRGGHWRGDRREEGAPSMVAGMGADGVSGKGNDEMDISKGGERNRRHFGSTSWCTGAGQEGEQARRGGGSRSMAALGFNTEEGERGEWASWAKWPHRLDEAGLVREESWTRLQESLGQNRFGPLEK